MNEESVKKFLFNINNTKYVRTDHINVIIYSIEKGLVERTGLGNFKLSPKGEDLLNGNLDWNML
jgi:hypothetical protein